MALFFSVASDNGDQQQHQRQHAPALFPPRWGACASEASRGGEDSFTKNVWRRLATGLLAFSAALLRTFGPRGRTPLQATSANGCARPCLFSAVYDCSQWPPLVRAQFYVRTNCPRRHSILEIIFTRAKCWPGEVISRSRAVTAERLVYGEQEVASPVVFTVSRNPALAFYRGDEGEDSRRPLPWARGRRFPSPFTVGTRLRIAVALYRGPEAVDSRPWARG